MGPKKKTRLNTPPGQEENLLPHQRKHLNQEKMKKGEIKMDHKNPTVELHGYLCKLCEFKCTLHFLMKKHKEQVHSNIEEPPCKIKRMSRKPKKLVQTSEKNYSVHLSTKVSESESKIESTDMINTPRKEKLKCTPKKCEIIEKPQTISGRKKQSKPSGLKKMVTPVSKNLKKQNSSAMKRSTEKTGSCSFRATNKNRRSMSKGAQTFQSDVNSDMESSPVTKSDAKKYQNDKKEIQKGSKILPNTTPLIHSDLNQHETTECKNKKTPQRSKSDCKKTHSTKPVNEKVAKKAITGEKSKFQKQDTSEESSTPAKELYLKHKGKISNADGFSQIETLKTDSKETRKVLKAKQILKVKKTSKMPEKCFGLGSSNKRFVTVQYSDSIELIKDLPSLCNQEDSERLDDFHKISTLSEIKLPIDSESTNPETDVGETKIVPMEPFTKATSFLEENKQETYEATPKLTNDKLSLPLVDKNIEKVTDDSQKLANMPEKEESINTIAKTDNNKIDSEHQSHFKDPIPAENNSCKEHINAEDVISTQNKSHKDEMNDGQPQGNIVPEKSHSQTDTNVEVAISSKENASSNNHQTNSSSQVNNDIFSDQCNQNLIQGSEAAAKQKESSENENKMVTDSTPSVAGSSSHAKRNNPSCFCESCQLTFASMKELMDHCKQSHPKLKILVNSSKTAKICEKVLESSNRSLPTTTASLTESITTVSDDASSISSDSTSNCKRKQENFDSPVCDDCSGEFTCCKVCHQHFRTIQSLTIHFKMSHQNKQTKKIKLSPCEDIVENKIVEGKHSENRVSEEEKIQTMITKEPQNEDITSERQMSENVITKEPQNEDITSERQMSENLITKEPQNEDITIERQMGENIISKGQEIENTVREDHQSKIIISKGQESEKIIVEGQHCEAKDKCTDNIIKICDAFTLKKEGEPDVTESDVKIKLELDVAKCSFSKDNTHKDILKEDVKDELPIFTDKVPSSQNDDVAATETEGSSSSAGPGVTDLQVTKVFNCKTCPKCFLTKKLLRRHVKKKHKRSDEESKEATKVKLYCCGSCKMFFTNETDHKAHNCTGSTSDASKKSQKCNRCFKTFTSPAWLKLHLSVCSQDKESTEANSEESEDKVSAKVRAFQGVIQCFICPLKLTDSESYKKHLKKQHKISKVNEFFNRDMSQRKKCSFCPHPVYLKNFDEANQHWVDNHMTTSVKFVPVSSVTSSTSPKTILKKKCTKIRLAKESPKELRVKCFYCENTYFSNWQSLNLHIRNEHETSKITSPDVLSNQAPDVIPNLQIGPCSLSAEEISALWNEPESSNSNASTQKPTSGQESEPASTTISPSSKHSDQNVFPDFKVDSVTVPSSNYLGGTLKCAYCPGSQYENWKIIRQHFREEHLRFPHPGFVIENNTVKFVSVSKESDHSESALPSKQSLRKSLQYQPVDMKTDSNDELGFKLEDIDDFVLKSNQGSMLTKQPSTVPKRIRCVYCENAYFQTWDLVKEHIYNVHVFSDKDPGSTAEPLVSLDLKPQKQQIFKCSFCPKRLRSRATLVTHIQENHLLSVQEESQLVSESEPVRIFCDHCLDDDSISAFLPDELKVHMSKFHPEVNYTEYAAESEDKDGIVESIADSEEESTDESESATEDVIVKSENKGVRCSFCPKEFFPDWSELKLHMFQNHLGVPVEEIPDIDPDSVSISNDTKIKVEIDSIENFRIFPEEATTTRPGTCQDDSSKNSKKKIQNHEQKSISLISNFGILDVDVENSLLVEEEPPSIQRDPYNASNDEFYNPKALPRMIMGCNVDPYIQHAIDTVIPTFLDQEGSERFHRPPLKNANFAVTEKKFLNYRVHSLSKHIQMKEKMRNDESQKFGGGNLFYMKTREDLSGKDGQLVLFEYSEEHPPLLNLVGMASKLFNYAKECDIEHKFGETIRLGSKSRPFLGTLKPGQMIQALENKMYRAPVYEHVIPPTDFIVIRNRMGFYIREADALFLCGQECPLIRVPKPTSKLAYTTLKKLMQAVVYRLFSKSEGFPKTLKMEELKSLFQDLSESCLRKRLKPCSKFVRTGEFASLWVLNSDFNLPTKEEIDAMVSHEDVCAYLSMVASEKRLTAAGYNFKSSTVDFDDDDDGEDDKVDDEVKAAPWQTTKAFMMAMTGKCLLRLNGPADPTGSAGVGFSYEYLSKKPLDTEKGSEETKVFVKGTDADLRKLTLFEAKTILKEQGMPQSELDKLTRWQVIDLIRTLSKEKMKAGVSDEMSKFGRYNPNSMKTFYEMYRKECQMLFDLQNQLLSSDETIDTDNEEDLSYDQEEDQDEIPKILKISRTFLNNDGVATQNVQIIRNPQIIKAYLKMRETKDFKVLKKFLDSKDDNETQEAIIQKKEKRKQQEKLRRLKRNMEKLKTGEFEFNEDGRIKKSKKPKVDLNIVCGACGGHGHMKTNKLCPLSGQKAEPVCEEQTAGAFVLKITKDLVTQSVPQKRRRAGTVENCDYLSHFKYKSTKRRRADPLVDLTNFFEKVMSEIRSTLQFDPFWRPVDSKKVPDYYQKIEKPMWLSKIQDKLEKRTHKSRAEFIADIVQIYENCKTYNGDEHPLTAIAEALLRFVEKKMSDHSEDLIALEIGINPLLLPEEDKLKPEEGLKALSHILQKIIDEKLSIAKEFWPFLKPVPRRLRDYYKLITEPMDLETMTKKNADFKYTNRDEFFRDVELIYKNSESYNGPESEYTSDAKKLFDTAKESVEEQSEIILKIENNIKNLVKYVPSSSSSSVGRDRPSKDVQRLQCPDCDGKFVTKSNLIRHQRLIHSYPMKASKAEQNSAEVDEGGTLIRCTFCPKKGTWPVIKDHIEKIHSKEETERKGSNQKQSSNVQNDEASTSQVTVYDDDIEIKEEIDDEGPSLLSCSFCPDVQLSSWKDLDDHINQTHGVDDQELMEVEEGDSPTGTGSVIELSDEEFEITPF